MCVAAEKMLKKAALSVLEFWGSISLGVEKLEVRLESGNCLAYGRSSAGQPCNGNIYTQANWMENNYLWSRWTTAGIYISNIYDSRYSRSKAQFGILRSWTSVAALKRTDSVKLDAWGDWVINETNGLCADHGEWWQLKGMIRYGGVYIPRKSPEGLKRTAVRQQHAQLWESDRSL